MDKKIKKHLPSYVSLYYVDYNDNLNDRHHAGLLQECIEKNSLQPLGEAVYDWWDCPTEEYMDAIRKAMEADGLEELYCVNEDEIRDWLYENDKSTPVEDLLRNTGGITFFYSLGMEVDGWHGGDFFCNPYRGESEAMAAYRVARKLGIRKGTGDYERIEEMVSEAGGGGELRIYFETSVDELISGAEENRLYWTNEDGKKDFKSMRFMGDVKIAIYNPNEGSGWETTVYLDKVFPFKRENLFVSETEKWDLENTFGMCGDWLRGKDTPAMLYKSCKGAIRESKTAERNKREAELTRAFRAGGCTHGDMDMNRHRDVHYVNEIPCGSHCPHCGTFWID